MLGILCWNASPAWGQAYTASQGFSSTQGANQWYYQEHRRTGANPVWDETQLFNMAWDAANSRWKGTYTYVLVGNNWNHPQTYESVRRWVAPGSGTIRIAGNARDAQPDAGDGVIVRINKNAAQLWTATIANGNTVGVDFDLTTTVAAGDDLYFRVNQNGTASYDTTFLDPMITFTSPGGVGPVAWWRLDDPTITMTDSVGAHTGHLWNSENMPYVTTLAASTPYPMTSNNHREGQTFTAATPIRSAGVMTPSWNNNVGTLVVTLYTNTAKTTAIASQTFVNYVDNEWLDLSFAVQAAGTYYLEWYTTTYPEKVGAWGRAAAGTDYAGGTAYSYTLPAAPAAAAYDFSVRWSEGVLTSTSAGRAGNAMVLDGTDDYVRVADATTLRLGTEQTIAFWVSVTGLGTDWDRLVGKGAASTRNYGVWLDANGDLLYQINSGSSYCNLWSDNTGLANIAAGSGWHHVAATRTGNTMKMYIDGAEKLAPGITCSISPPTSADPLTMGYDYGITGGDYFSGLLDEVKIWSRALSSTEIAAEVAAGGPTVPTLTTQPTSITVTAPNAAAFSVTAVGAVSYQWQRGPTAWTDIGGATAAGYTLNPTSVGDSGAQFRVRVTNTAGSVTSDAATLTVNAPPPVIGSLSPAAGPAGTLVTIFGSNFGASQDGSTVSFSGVSAAPVGWNDTSISVPVPSGAATGPVVATVGGIPSNGVDFTVMTNRTLSGKVTRNDGITPIAGATVKVFEGGKGVGTAAADTGGDYAIVLQSPSGGGPDSELVSISTRAYVNTGTGAAIPGFIIQGTDPMTVLIRTTGPGLAAYGVVDVLPNPYLRLYSGSTLVARNDNWQAADPLCAVPVISCGSSQQITATGLDPCSDNTPNCALESALLVTLPPGAYSAPVTGVGTDVTGLAVASVYDVDPGSSSRLINISTRVYVELGEKSARADFVIQGADPQTVLIKSIGPALSSFGIPDFLPNPTIRLYSEQTLLARNDDWQTTDPVCAAPSVHCGDAQGILQTASDPCDAGYPGCTLESAILVTLPPGQYTADLTGTGSDPSGVGMIVVLDMTSGGVSPPGDLTVQASASGYVTQGRTGITVPEGQTTTVDFSLDAVSSGGVISNDWSPRINWKSGSSPVSALHLSLLPNGDLIAMGPKTFKMVPTPQGEPLPSEAAVEEMSALVPYEEATDSLYCSGHILLGDGVFFTVGGLSGGYGMPYAMSYENDTGWMRFDQHTMGTGDTAAAGTRHWYPSATLLADSRVLVTAGRDLWQGFYSENRSLEIFDPASASWSLVSPHSSSPAEIFNFNYSHVFQLPRPVGQFDVLMIGEDGYPVLFSTATGQWQVRPNHRPPGTPILSNLGSSTLMLPIRLNDYEWGYSNGSILTAGGGQGTDYISSADVYDPVLNSWRELNLAVQRQHVSEVLLPDGRILVVAGYNTSTDPNAIPTGFAQIVDPSDNFSVSWSRSAYGETRAYHTVTLLLPDGRVLVGGGNDNGNAGNEKPDFRYFYPDYFEGPRPEIVDVPDHIEYGASHSIAWRNTIAVSEVVLLAVGSMTHSIDFSQRHIQLQIQGSSNGATLFLGPPDSAIAPPGYYMLFVLDGNRKPSVGKIVQVGNPPVTLRSPGPPLVAVEKSGTNSGSAELHLLSRATNFRDVIADIGTALPESDDARSFKFADWDGDSKEDLVVIKKSGTASGTTEVQILSGASDFQSDLLNTATALAQTDDTFDFAFADWNGDSVNDLVAIKKSGTGTGKTEIHVLSGAALFQTFLLNIGTALAQTNDTFAFAFADWNGDFTQDLIAIKKSLTGSASTEVHVLSGATNFQTFLIQTGSVLQETDASWEFQFADWNKDSKQDLIAIHKSGTASGKTEVKILSGATNFQSFLQQMETVLPETDDRFEFVIN